MIVGRADRAVMPVADKLIAAACGRKAGGVDFAEAGWSKELALHLIEVKTLAPHPDLGYAAGLFARQVRRINELLAPLGGVLMPGGAHPLMNPAREAVLWPHEDREIYAAYDRIFGCSGHGWTNLQSVQLNLPFADDDEFARLHAAVRLVLPLLPALAAASPYFEGRFCGFLAGRLDYYRRNQVRVPAVAGHVIPERAFSRSAYQERILEPMYAAIAPWDPAGLLQEEWLNSRGAIARFDRMAIEIRLMDAQECPEADFAALALVTAAVRALVEERWISLNEQMAWPEERLESILLEVMREADTTVIRDAEYLRILGCPAKEMRALEVWRHLAESSLREPERARFREPLRVILERGPLARRMIQALGMQPSREDLVEMCRTLSACLAGNRLLLP